MSCCRRIIIILPIPIVDGATQEGRQTQQVGPVNKYQFNGTERIDEFGLDWNHTLYRSYDNWLGRWSQIDPKHSERESGYVGLGNNPISFSDMLGDTLRGVNRNSAIRQLSLIQMTFGSLGSAGENMANLFQLADDNTFASIGIKDFEAALENLNSAEAKWLAIGYFVLVNDYKTHVIEMLGSQEEISAYGQMVLGDGSTKGSDIDENYFGGKSAGAKYDGNIVRVGHQDGVGVYGIMLMNPQSKVDYYAFFYKKGEIELSMPSLLEELHAHEMFGHGLGVGIGFNQSGDVAEAVQMGNVVLRLRNQSYYRRDHDGQADEAFKKNPYVNSQKEPVYLMKEYNRVKNYMLKR